jgi:DNA replication protein DnaC
MAMTKEQLIEAVRKMNAKKGDLKGYHCSRCNDEGIYYYIKDDWFEATICPCLKLRRSKAGITFDSYEAKENWQMAIKKRAMEYTQREDRWFFIGGQVGAGKTHICKAILTELSKSKSVDPMEWISASRALKGMVNTPEYQAETNRYKKAQVLLIDDFFYGNVTDADKSLAREIIDYRYIEGLTTIINSELTISEIASIDEGTAGRIKERAGQYVMNLSKDIRKDMRV